MTTFAFGPAVPASADIRKVAPADYPSVMPLIDRTSCGSVYPLSVVEGTQRGDVYASRDSVLLWHDCGFAFVFGACDDGFLQSAYETFLRAERRFVLFANTERVRRFFRGKGNLSSAVRLFYEYPDGRPANAGTLPGNLRLREIDAQLFDSIQGQITPLFSWPDASRSRAVA